MLKLFLKNPEKQILKKKLEQLKNIATRKNEVDDIISILKKLKM